jgi:hypothetical protein
MSLLERIAYSDGNPQRTIAAVHIIHDLLKQEVSQQSTPQTAVASKQNKFKKRQATIQLPMVLGV